VIPRTGYLGASSLSHSRKFHLPFIARQIGCATNGSMPILHSADSRSATGVLGDAPLLAGLPPFASRLLPLKQAHDLYERARNRGSRSILENLLREMEVEVQVDLADLERIPKAGPVVRGPQIFRSARWPGRRRSA
jgi:hypothetical protein